MPSHHQIRIDGDDDDDDDLQISNLIPISNSSKAVLTGFFFRGDRAVAIGDILIRHGFKCLFMTL